MALVADPRTFGEQDMLHGTSISYAADAMPEDGQGWIADKQIVISNVHRPGFPRD